jgi:hypothetical protein
MTSAVAFLRDGSQRRLRAASWVWLATWTTCALRIAVRAHTTGSECTKPANVVHTSQIFLFTVAIQGSDPTQGIFIRILRSFNEIHEAEIHSKVRICPK